MGKWQTVVMNNRLADQLTFPLTHGETIAMTPTMAEKARTFQVRVARGP